ncbi:MAG: molybdopterin molybdotransferase MoeA [Thermodesulfobacteriota bacterium]|nr:molybdopterin molybdotransferase MoeA [Thermodesulfobacteriota bacterium]
MKEFFKVTDLDKVFNYITDFPAVETEPVYLSDMTGRILADNIISDIDLPAFSRSTMDGYAVKASSTFGATEGNPAYLTVKGSVSMGESPDFSIRTGEAARISTGGMLPDGCDSVVMIEHAEALDDTTIEIYKSVAPGQHVVEAGEDIERQQAVLTHGEELRPQEIGLLAALGKDSTLVYKKPIIGIISTGDEVVPIDSVPGPGQIRDINTYTLSGQVQEAGGIPITFGIVRDDYNALYHTCTEALSKSDMVLISGGSSVGMRDYTIEVLSNLPDSSILVHGISISPGKPTILARTQSKAFWGLPGHVTSAMVVFQTVVRPFIRHIAGSTSFKDRKPNITANLSRNIASAQGRVDYIRVRMLDKDGVWWAEPILGKSGLIHTMVKANGLIKVGKNTEGLDKGSKVEVIPL